MGKTVINTEKSGSIQFDMYANALVIEQEINWCVKVIETRLEEYFSGVTTPESQSCIYNITPPSFDNLDVNGGTVSGMSNSGLFYAEYVKSRKLSFDERIVLIMALIPHVRPSAFDIFFIRNATLDRGYTEFGGWNGKNHSGFLPTCETAVFVLAGGNLAKRMDVQKIFDTDHCFCKDGMIKIEYGENGEPFLSGMFQVTNEYVSVFTKGQKHKPDYSTGFPAKLITSKLTRKDLVLEPDVQEEIAAIETWLVSGKNLMREWGLEKNVKPGYRCLFYGPPGTGKTLTATLLGASAGLDVYRVDLSMLVSKYIGETEKNLANVFNQAQNKNWILFFDEADALFGKRTQTSSSNDRHANQEVAYLLQRIEDCPNMVILASNLKSNIDEAFMRRFQSVVYFPMPGVDQRLLLWKGLCQNENRIDADVNLQYLAEEYELSGGSLINAVQFAVLLAVYGKRNKITQNDLIAGLQKELRKVGKNI